MSQSPILYDVDAEQNIFACILQEQVSIENIKITPAEMHEGYHTVLLDTMLDLWKSSCPLTPGLIFHDLVRTKKLANAAPPNMTAKAYLEFLKAKDVNPEHIHHYAGIVSKYARVRRYVRLAADIIKKAHDDQADPDELDAMITESQVHLSGGNSDALLRWKDAAAYYEQILDERDKKKSMPADEQDKWDLPWASWNALIDECSAGMIMLFGGGTSVGKSIFGENTGEYWASSKHHIAYFHFELNRELMLDRRTARFSKYSRRDLVSKLSPEARQEIRETNQALGTWEGGVEYVHCPGWNIDQVIRQIRSMHAAGICDGFVIDYLEKMQGTEKQWRRFGNEYRIEADNLEQLKNVAEALGLRGVVLAQLTKDGNEVAFEDLTLSKIAGAKAKADKVNVVALIHRERLDNGERNLDGSFEVEPGQRSNTVNVRIDKNTMGRTGIITMRISPSNFAVH